MASNFEAKTGAALIFNTLVEYILTTDSVLGDQADLVDSSNFGGKINVVLQAFFDNLNYLKDEVDNFSSGPSKASQTQGRSGTNDSAYMTSLRVLDAMRSGSSFEADTTRKGTSERANQSEGRAGTNDTNFMTPLRTKDQLQNAISPATMSVSSGTITVRTNIVIGNLLFMRVENTGSDQLPTNTVWTLGGGAWRLLCVSLYNSSENYVEIGELGTATILASDISYNANDTTFTLSGHSGYRVEQNDELNIIAIKV